MVRYEPKDAKEEDNINTEDKKMEEQLKSTKESTKDLTKTDKLENENALDESKSEESDKEIDINLKKKENSTKDVPDMMHECKDLQVLNPIIEQEKLKNQAKIYRISLMFVTVLLLIVASMLYKVHYIVSNSQERISSIENKLQLNNEYIREIKENISKLTQNSIEKEPSPVESSLMSYRELSSIFIKNGDIKVFNKDSNITLSFDHREHKCKGLFHNLFENSKSLPELNTINVSFEYSHLSEMCVVLKTIMPIKVKSLVLSHFEGTNCDLEFISRITDKIEIVYSRFDLSSFIKSSYHLEVFNFTNSESINGGEYNFAIKDFYRIKIIRTSFSTFSYNGDLYFYKTGSFSSFIKAISKSGLKDSLHLITVLGAGAPTHNYEFLENIRIGKPLYVRVSDLVKEYNLTHIKIE